MGGFCRWDCGHKGYSIAVMPRVLTLCRWDWGRKGFALAVMLIVLTLIGIFLKEIYSLHYLKKSHQLKHAPMWDKELHRFVYWFEQSQDAPLHTSSATSDKVFGDPQYTFKILLKLTSGI